MPLIDLKVSFPECHTPASIKQETTYELRENDIFTTNGIPSYPRISHMRCTIQRQLQGQKLHLLGPISLHGIRSTHLSGEPEGYPGMSQRNEIQALASAGTSLAIPWPMPTRSGTGASTPTSPRCSSGRPEDCTSKKALAWSWIRQSMPWIPPQSICVFPCFLGHYSARGKERSRCTPSWICGAVFLPWLSLLTDVFTMSLSSIVL